ncbi:ferric reductase transmembrane component, variant 2 [Coprinopsis cinerea AmutBmut pab1-1]|nr:ferric reductase transmembrane component, variant 2 [Coprinopsis cinerea AmutBmut pab1-1]
MATIQNTTNINPQFEAQLIKSTTLVFNVNLFIYALIAVVAILRVPHLIGLFGTTSEWYSGHFLHYSEPKEEKVRVQRNDSSRTIVARHNSTKSVGRNNSTKTTLNRNASTKTTLERHNSTKTVVGGKEEEYAMDDYALPYSGGNHRRRGQVERVDVKYPPHFAVVPPFFRPLLSLSRVRLFDGYSTGQLALLASYFYTLVYATFFKSNPFIDATRPAWVAISQMPLLFALAQKNSLLGSLLGYGYEKLNYIHRFVGKLVILASNLHSIYYFYRWTAAGTFSQAIARPKNAWGMVALIFMDLMYIFSTQFWRSKAYNLFIWSHTILFALLLPAVYLHQPSLLPYVLACVFLYGADRAMRILKTRITTATIITVPELDITQVEIPSLNSGWRAGQHVRLRVMSRGMGWFGLTEVHPFTIATAPNSHDGLILMCKNAGDWTRRLGQLAKERGYDVGETRVKVWVEGPYGGPGRMIFPSFSGVVLVVGGSGITFGLAMLQDLVAKDLKGESRAKYIELVWVCPDAASVAPLASLFTGLIQQSIYTPIRISVYYTRAISSKLPFSTGGKDASPHLPIAFHPNFTLTPGRPKIGKALDSAIAKAVSLGPGRKGEEGIMGVAVGVCGPAGLGDDVVKAVAGIDAARRDQVGGIEIHEE